MQDLPNKREPSLMPWLMVWFCYMAFYEITKLFNVTNFISGWLMFFGGFATSMLIGGYSAWFILRTSSKIRLTFILLLISSLFLLTNGSIYHYLYNVLHFTRAQVSITLFSTYNLLYLGYLITQVAVWISILATLPPQERRSTFFCVPATVIVLAAFLIYIFAVQWNITSFSLIGFYDGLDEILQLFSFVAAALCLITSQNRGLTYLALGYLIVRIAGFVMGFRFFAQAYGSGSIAEAGWLLGDVITIYGLYLIKKTSVFLQNTPWVAIPSTTRSQIAFWSFISSIGAFALLSIVAFVFKL